MTAGVWALVAASGLAWGWRSLRVRPAVPTALAAPPAAPEQAPDPALLLRLLSAADLPNGAALAPASARFSLQGVIASAQGAAGVALIAVDGKPARAYRVGQSLDGQWLLQSLQPRSASLGQGQGGPLLRLELPASAAGSLATPVAPGASVGQASAAPPAALPAPPVPSLRMATPGEIVAPGRRQRLRSRGAQPLAPTQ